MIEHNGKLIPGVDMGNINIKPLMSAFPPPIWNWREMAKQTSDGNLRFRFNPQNSHHQRAAEYLTAIRGKYKAALIVAALEEYQQQHPYGPDYQELERIRLASHRSFLPKRPILQNLLQRKVIQQERTMTESTKGSTPAIWFKSLRTFRRKSSGRLSRRNS